MIATSKNLLLDDIEFKYEETGFGTWRRFKGDDGSFFEEFKSHADLAGLPLVHITRGKNPETGRGVTAKGVFAMGRIAVTLSVINIKDYF